MNNKKITVQNIVPASLAVNQRAWLCGVLAGLEKLVLTDDAWHEQMIDDWLSQFGAGVLLAIDADDNGDWWQVLQASPDRLAGYCLYQSVFELAEIHRIGTHPDHLRQGVATALMDRLVVLLKDLNAQSLLLEVRADNTAAILLYQQQGLVQIDVRNGYYQNQAGQKIDAIIMQKNIA